MPQGPKGVGGLALKGHLLFSMCKTTGRQSSRQRVGEDSLVWISALLILALIWYGLGRPLEPPRFDV